jgi:hypothetical protein
MPSILYTQARGEIADGTINLLTDVLVVMLVNNVYVPSTSDLVVDAGTAFDPASAEIATTNYVPGWGGAGRMVLSSKTIFKDFGLNAAFLRADNVLWTALGAAVEISAAILIKEGLVNDTTSRLIGYFDVADVFTNDGDIIVQWNPLGLFKF